MNEAAFSTLADLVRRRAGIALMPHKAHAISGRLTPVARIFGFPTTDALLADLAHADEELARAVTEAMTTQDTAFFRDPAVFDHFARDMLPALTQARAARKRLRIWSAGCATGQEAYSLAILLDRANLAANGWSVDLIATDLSGNAIARARDGVYSSYETERGLPDDERARSFAPDGEGWRVAERLRRTVMFRAFNLLDHFGWLGEIDIVFCRNVLMYLAAEEKASVLDKLSKTLAGDGRIVLGTAEGIANNAHPFRPAAGPPGVYLNG